MKKFLLVFIISSLVVLSGCTNKDNENPVIEGLEQLKVTYQLGSPTPNWVEGITASDNMDGDLTASIKVDTNINMNEEGAYEVAYLVSDKAKNITLEIVNVNVADFTGPRISGITDITIDVNSTNKPDWFKDVTAEDIYDGDVTNQIIVDDSNANYGVPGDYIVYYNLTDSNDNSLQIPITLTVQEIGTRINPVTLGNNFIVSGHDNLYGDYKVKLSINRIKRGQEAENLVLSDNLNNEPSDDKHEYLITNVTLELLEVDESNAYYQQNGFSNWDNFILIPNVGRIYDTSTSIEIPNPINECKLDIRSSCTGNLVHLVDEADTFILKYNNNWFSLTDDEPPIVPPDQIIGYSMDVVKSDYADYKDIKFDKPIFDETWLASLTLGKGNLFSSTTGYYTIPSFKELPTRKSLMRYSDIILYNDEYYIEKKLSSFPSWIEAEYDQYANEFYYVMDAIFKIYMLYMPAYSYVSEYWDHLNSDFLDYLNKLSNNEISYEDFFDQYGTHYIANGIFGASVDMSCSVLSNQYEEIQKSLCADINLTPSFVKDITTPYDEDSNSNNKTYFSIKTSGGSNYTFTGSKNYSENYSNWLKTIDDEHELTLVDFGQKGLMPLWELLPPSYEHLKDDMQTEFIDYYNSEYKNE